MKTESDNAARGLTQLLHIMSTLRSPEGCPWDIKQTPESLKPFILEETYELLDALDKKNPDDICDELGDLLLQIVFLAQIFREQGSFDMAAVIRSINDKMIRRHPHVFADEEPENHAFNWERIKQQERSSKGRLETLDERIPKTLPALKRASKVAKKLNPEDGDTIIESLIERLKEVKVNTEIKKMDSSRHLNQLGDICFGIAQLCVALQCDAENILRQKTSEVIASLDHQE